MIVLLGQVERMLPSCANKKRAISVRIHTVGNIRNAGALHNRMLLPVAPFPLSGDLAAQVPTETTF